MKAAAALLREQVESSLAARTASHWSAAFSREKPAPEEIVYPAGGIPRGALTEIAGPPSSGRTALLCSLLAAAVANQEFCALIDAEDRFDPASAAAAGVRLSQVLWVRCGGNVEHALKSADMLAAAGGFGLVAIDLGDTPVGILRRLPMAVWFRLRHAVENTRTALVTVARQVHANSCSALKIECRRSQVAWQGRPPGRLLGGFETAVERVRNHRSRPGRFYVDRTSA